MTLNQNVPSELLCFDRSVERALSVPSVQNKVYFEINGSICDHLHMYTPIKLTFNDVIAV